MPVVYVLHSNSLKRYYTGCTSLAVEERLEQHLNRHFGETKFTGAAKDWTLALTMECDNMDQARKVEQHIKNMKSRKYIENLVAYPEMRDKLLERYR